MNLGWKLPLERLSASSMGMAIQCPEQFRQKYLVKTPEQSFGARFIGSVDHEMSRVMATAKMYGSGETAVNVDALYREAWNAVLDKDGEPDWRDDDPTKMFERGVKMSKLYWDEVIVKEVKPVAVETRLEFTIPGVPAKIVGFADLIEADKIRERKTTAVKTTKPKPKWRFQGLIYQYATGLPVQWDVVTRQVTPQLYLARDWPDLYLAVRPTKFIEGMIRDVARRINDLYSQFGSDNTWPMTGIFGDWLCDYCPIGPRYGGSCPAWMT